MLFEQVGEVVGADIEFLGDALQGQIFPQVSVNIEQNLVDLPVGGELQPYGPVDGLNEIFTADGLEQQVAGSQAQGSLGILKNAVGGHNDEFGPALFRPGLFNDLQSCQDRHLDVHENQIRVVLPDGLQRGLAVAHLCGDGYGELFLLQKIPDELAHSGLVVRNHCIQHSSFLLLFSAGFYPVAFFSGYDIMKNKLLKYSRRIQSR